MQPKFYVLYAALIVGAASVCLYLNKRIEDNTKQAMPGETREPETSSSASAPFLPVPESLPTATSSEPNAPRALIQTAGAMITNLSKSNDPNDRFRAYGLAYRCWTLHEMEARERNTVQAEREAAHPERAQYQGACDGVTDSQLTSRYDNLKIAVAANVRGAAHQYLVEGPFGDHDALTQRPDDPLVVQWKQETVAALNSSAVSGDRVAITDLMQLYDSGVIVPRDPVRSLTYLLVENQLAAQSGHPHNSTYVQRAEAALTADQVAQATQESKIFYQHCCAKKY